MNTNLNNKLNLSDTSDMLFNYKTGFNDKLNISDTVSMLGGYLRKSDTSSLSDRINAKLSSADFPSGTAVGNLMYWDGTRWVILAPGAEGQVLTMSSGLPIWRTSATPAFTCGTIISDIDGNSYNTILIGTQCWTKENLRVRRYNNGTAIQFDATGGSGGISTTWQNLTVGAHTIYAHDSVATPSNLTKYGYLYNWYAAKGIYTTGTILSNDTLNICPVGWHVPTDAEWTTLTSDQGGESVTGGKIKSIGTSYWNDPNTGATNVSGFSALPGGYRYSDGGFINVRSMAFFWSAMEVNSSAAWNRHLYNNDITVVRGNNFGKNVGASIRCIRD